MQTTNKAQTTCLTSLQTRINRLLSKTIAYQPGLPDQLRQAINHSVLNGGKRLRPLMVYLTGACFAIAPNHLDSAAAAIELIHCYSLIHDDLPAMDNAELRRGKPACHCAFDEATAILAGDILQSIAFHLIAQQTLPAPAIQSMLMTLSQAARDMVSGQMLDILSEKKKLTKNEMMHMQQLKTGRLFTAAIELGATTADAPPKVMTQLKLFSEQLGLAFQIQDDIFDQTHNATTLGKSTGLDQQQHKTNYLSFYSINEAKQAVDDLMIQAKQLLESINFNPQPLQQLCDIIWQRQC